MQNRKRDGGGISHLSEHSDQGTLQTDLSKNGYIWRRADVMECQISLSSQECLCTQGKKIVAEPGRPPHFCLCKASMIALSSHLATTTFHPGAKDSYILAKWETLILFSVWLCLHYDHFQSSVMQPLKSVSG